MLASHSLAYTRPACVRPHSQTPRPLPCNLPLPDTDHVPYSLTLTGSVFLLRNLSAFDCPRPIVRSVACNQASRPAKISEAAKVHYAAEWMACRRCRAPASAAAIHSMHSRRAQALDRHFHLSPALFPYLSESHKLFPLLEAPRSVPNIG